LSLALLGRLVASYDAALDGPLSAAELGGWQDAFA
jgi:hypothetical protein